MRENSRSDITIVEVFKTRSDQNELVPAPVPSKVRIDYFTLNRKNVWTCLRDGDNFRDCQLSQDGMSLICFVALSRVYLGEGPLLKVVSTLDADPAFPNSVRAGGYLASTGIDLWAGPPESDEVESSVVISAMKYGYSAYQLAVLNGFDGTEAEWLISLGITSGGTWTAGQSYKAKTYVLFRGDGCGYIALKANVDVTPGTDDTTWAKAAEAGMSIYQLCVAHGTFDGTEAEFVAAYDAAVKAANAAALAASQAKATIEESERGRVAAETARVLAESGRADAESARVLAETTRENQAAEDHRVAGEDHTIAASDHGTATGDHAQYLEDHDVVAGYNTRLTNVKGAVDALALGAKVTLTASPSVVYKGMETNISLIGSMSAVTPSSLTIKDGDTTIATSTNSASVSGTATATITGNSKAFTCQGVIEGVTLLGSVTVNARNPIYYGFGASYSDVAVAAHKLAATTTAARTYSGTASANGQHFYILVPSDISDVSSFTMGGAPFAMNAVSQQTIGGVTYRVHESSVIYNSGTTVNVAAS